MGHEEKGTFLRPACLLSRPLESFKESGQAGSRLGALAMAEGGESWWSLSEMMGWCPPSRPASAGPGEGQADQGPPWPTAVHTLEGEGGPTCRSLQLCLTPSAIVSTGQGMKVPRPVQKRKWSLSPWPSHLSPEHAGSRGLCLSGLSLGRRQSQPAKGTLPGRCHQHLPGRAGRPTGRSY